MPVNRFPNFTYVELAGQEYIKHEGHLYLVRNGIEDKSKHFRCSVCVYTALNFKCNHPLNGIEIFHNGRVGSLPCYGDHQLCILKNKED